jgi:hypothetical protein
MRKETKIRWEMQIGKDAGLPCFFVGKNIAKSPRPLRRKKLGLGLRFLQPVSAKRQ